MWPARPVDATHSGGSAMQWKKKSASGDRSPRPAGTVSQRSARGRGRKARKRRKAVQLTPLHKPENMSLEAWQIELRRQFGRQQTYPQKNLGDQPIFSEFQVFNPKTQSSYRVH